MEEPLEQGFPNEPLGVHERVAVGFGDAVCAGFTFITFTSAKFPTFFCV